MRGPEDAQYILFLFKNTERSTSFYCVLNIEEYRNYYDFGAAAF